MVKTLHARFDGKVLIPEEPVDLPEGRRLTVTVEEIATAEPPPQSRPIAELLREFAESLSPDPDSPGDAAAQHDHYLYGTPKRDNP